MPKLVHHTDWLLLVLFFSAALVLVARVYDVKKFRVFALLPFRSTDSRDVISFRPLSRNLFDVSMAFNSYVIWAVALVLLGVGYGSVNPDLSLWPQFLRVFFMLVGFFLVRDLVQLVIGWVYGALENVVVAQNRHLAHRSWAGIYLLPLVFIVVFFKNFFVVGWWLLAPFLAGAYLFTVYKSGSAIWQMPVSLYYKFLYLCALEIVPVFFLLSWL